MDTKVKVGDYVQTTTSDRVGQVKNIDDRGFLTIEYGKCDHINNWTPLVPGEVITSNIHTAKSIKRIL